MSQERPANQFRNQARQVPPTKAASYSAGSYRSPSSGARSYGSRSTGRGYWSKAKAFMRERPLLQRLYGYFLKLLLFAFLFSILWVVVLKFVPVWFTPLVIARKVEAIGAGEDSKIHKTWRSYDKISKEVALAVVASEDQNFPTHWGFDLDEIRDALSENRKRLRGASTISQQVAKNVFLWNGRSYIRKALEAYFTVLIELIWGKERILEVYLNVAEMGPMTFGVEAASQRYYGHAASTLSRSEAARIAAVLPSPRRFSIRNPSGYVQRRTSQITRQMRALGGKAYIRNL
ncbi:monofunctional biosynthetic peptidoglycan transglycosylase [Nibrella saemangeumensis]